VNSINLSSTLTLVGNGSGCDVFVINVTDPTAVFNFNGDQIVLSGGLTPDRVTFNFPGTGGGINIFKNNAIFRGTILAPQRDVEIDSAAVFGSVIGSTVNVHSGGSVTECHCPPPCP